MPLTADVVVVGLGGMGSAALCHLAQRGLRVLGLERFTPGHDRGSSHGLTRIIRLAYHEDPSYVPLLRRAYALWRDLESGLDTPLLHVTGSLDIGLAGSRVVEGSLRSCDLHGLAYERLTAGDVNRRFPGYALPDEYEAVLQPEGGFLVPERCIDAHLQRAVSLGASVRSGVVVRDWRVRDGVVEVDLGDERVTAGRLVLAAGAWMPALVPALRPLLSVERQVVGWFEAPRHAFNVDAFPVFNLLTPTAHYYGFPEFGVPGFKVGRYHHLFEPSDPDQPARTVTARDEAALRDGIRECFRSADGPMLRASTCLFTNTPDEHFIVDRLTEAPEVIVVSACSGHGFKFCSVLGEVVADLVVAGESAHDIRQFGLARFAGPPPRQPPAGHGSGEP